ncbi:MAG: DUF6666 family protein [Rhodopirellula sp. JB044]|uniref:DUF6666 family protein n=1 Tax=Rhodopirellula sp. JB044 TaxID=3342844 RepID=UPI00370BE038
MPVTKTPRFTSIVAKQLVLGVALLIAPGFAADVSAEGPVRILRTKPTSRTSWSPSRVDADASAVTTQPTQTVRRASSSQSRSRSSNGEVRQVGFLEDYGACGPVCDCGECSGSMMRDPGCGLEGGYVAEPGCGLEPGCGIEPGCGLEPGCGFEPACGMEVYGDACGCDACTSGIGSCDGYACAPSCRVDCFPLFLPILHVDWNRFEFFIGNQAYHNPMNDPATGAATSTDSGSFGFQQGFNEGRNLRPWIGLDLAAQFGLRATQSNLQGEDFTDEQRNQIFLTGGLFRRVDYGLQYGVVLDYLNEDWYYQTDLLQLRGELSWKWSACHGFGFHWMGGVSDDTVTTTVLDESGAVFNGSETLEATNQYRAFYRYSFGSTGEWTSYIGGTDDEHFLIGSDMTMPLKNGLSMRLTSTYFSPGDDSVIPDHQAEGWNMGISMTYRPGFGKRSSRYCRPLFDVAHNGTFFVFR